MFLLLLKELLHVAALRFREAVQVGSVFPLKWLEGYGIVTNEILPSDAAFVPGSALFERFPDVDRSKAFEWMLQALRYGRYSGSATTSLDEDLREIENAASADEAIERMRRRIRV